MIRYFLPKDKTFLAITQVSFIKEQRPHSKTYLKFLLKPLPVHFNIPSLKRDGNESSQIIKRPFPLASISNYYLL
jgi:hypothetical protein